MDQLRSFIVKNKWALILAIGGVLYVLLCMQIGFWRTILLTLVAGVCAFIGNTIDKKKRDNDE